MNLHTFKDVVNAKKSSLVNDLDEGDEEKEVGVLRKPVEGEEDNGDDKFNEAGEVLEPFNLRDERDSGHFDENMNFVFQKEKGEIDAWLADMDEAAMEQGIGEAAKALRIRQEKISQAEAIASAKVKKSIIELKTLLLKMMKPGENVVQAMRRMSGKQSLVGKAKKRLPKSQNVDTAEVMPETETKEQKLANRLALEEFSDLTDELLSRGLSGVYDMTYEAIENSAVRWEYRGLDGVVQGPFPPQTIAAWKAQGYFSGSSAVMMRKVGTIGKDWDGNQENPMSKSNQINGEDGDAGRNSSSTATASAVGKVRFNFDADSSIDQKSKKAKIEVSATAESTTQDLMDDLEDGDDDDDEINEKSGISVDPVVSTKTVTIPTIDNLVRGEWMSSDDIEFEVTLEVEEKKEAEDVEADVDDDEDDI